ncbi:hypothetical protein D1872_250120 [compost metagenome]
MADSVPDSPRLLSRELYVFKTHGRKKVNNHGIPRGIAVADQKSAVAAPVGGIKRKDAERTFGAGFMHPSSRTAGRRPDSRDGQAVSICERQPAVCELPGAGALPERFSRTFHQTNRRADRGRPPAGGPSGPLPETASSRA